MSLTSSTQASIAFKNISGKSITDTGKGVNNEAEGIFFNIDSDNVWISPMSPTPSVLVANGVAVFVTANLSLDITSNGRGYFATWPASAPVGIDPITSLPYSYGVGVLNGINSGDRVRDAIPPSYGVLYEAKPYSSGPTIIPPGDPRNWIYQYNSGVFFQQDVIGPAPIQIDLYVYVGERLSDQTVVAQSSNIRVTALGTDNYSGIGTPSIATYSSSDMYLVDFENVNTGSTAVTLEINGLGAAEVIIFDENGFPVGLTGGGEINAGQIYYVTWDGINFQLNYSNPQTTSPILYTNLVGSVAVGGIPAGTTFSNATMKDMWDALLKPPYQQSNFTSFSFNHGGATREVGDAIIGGPYNFTWATSFPANVQTDSVTIRDLTNNVNLISGTANDGFATLTLSTINKSIPATHTWRAQAVRTNSTVFYSANVTVSWFWKRYHGTQSLTSLTAAQIQSLTGALSNSRLGNYTFGAGGYKYFAWPTSFGAPVLFRDFNTNLAVAMAGIDEGYTSPVGSYYAQVVSVTNIWGYTTNYYLFRTRNILGGSIIITVT
jgi:hypothetical protein